MKALILAAGIGKRLKPFTQTSAKCLVKIGGRTLLDRYIESLGKLGVSEAVVVVGHFKDKVMAEAGTGKYGVSVRYIDNPRYTEGNIYSVYLASREFDDDVLMMDADVLFHHGLLERLVRSSNKSCYLMDEGFIEEMGEECKVAALNGRVVANNRVIKKEFDRVGEGLGFLKLSKDAAVELRKILEDFVRSGGTEKEYEDALEVLLERKVVGFEPVGDLPWTEIDFPEDIAKAEELAARHGL